MTTRKLTNLYQDQYTDKKWNIHFAYYDENNRWDHTWDECSITEEQLFNVLKPHLSRKEG